MTTSLYEADFYAWANEQAALLRTGKLSDADVENIAEEIESMGKTEKRELVSRLTVLLMHLLKWRYQPERRGKSWRRTIREQRIRLASHMNDNPGLRARISDAMTEGYRLALIGAADETDLPEDTFPTECTWSFDQAMDEGFWPEASTWPNRSPGNALPGREVVPGPCLDRTTTMTNTALHRALLSRRFPQFPIADDQPTVSGKFSLGTATADWTITFVVGAGQWRLDVQNASSTQRIDATRIDDLVQELSFAEAGLEQ